MKHVVCRKSSCYTLLNWKGLKWEISAHTRRSDGCFGMQRAPGNLRWVSMTAGGVGGHLSKPLREKMEKTSIYIFRFSTKLFGRFHRDWWQKSFLRSARKQAALRAASRVFRAKAQTVEYLCGDFVARKLSVFAYLKSLLDVLDNPHEWLEGWTLEHFAI